MKNDERKWCMCTSLKGVARDMYATCSICGGMDAYGKSKLRPPEFEKRLSYTEPKEQDVCPDCGGSGIAIVYDSEKSTALGDHFHNVPCPTCTGKAYKENN